MADTKYWVAFHRIPNIGAARFRLLEKHFGTLDHAWTATLGELKTAGLDNKTAQSVTTHRVGISPDEEMEKLDRYGVLVANWHHPMYPPRLKEIDDSPPILYIRGEILPEDERSVAVVGTRKASAYGREVASSLAHDLSKNGVAVVSGLARGIDSISHQSALEAGGRTIAVFGSGLDIIYPAENAGLARRIESSGALVSEQTLGAKPDARHFPRRNRIISGMTLGTLVIEAPETSGAMITVRWALEQNCEVFCVSGSIFSPASRGTNALIQEGAKLVMSCKDILEELNLTVVTHQIEMRSILEPEGDHESDLLTHVSHEPLHIDEIRRRAQLPIASVSSALALMELKGLVKQVGSRHYIRVREVAVGYGS